MQIPDSVVFDYSFNALWEMPLIVAAAAGVVRLGRARATVAHRVWVGCLLLAVVTPGLSLMPRQIGVPGAGAGQAASPMELPGRASVDAGVQVSAVTPARISAGAGRSFGGVLSRFAPWRATLLQGLCWLYAGSVAYALARLMGGLPRTHRLVRSALPTSLTPEMRNTLDACLQAFGMTQIAVVSAAGCVGPATVSWPRPLIFLPAELHGADASEMAAAFCHELAHVRRGDFLKNLAYQACGALLFFHPAMHWAMRRLRETREMACDEMAAVALGGTVLRRPATDAAAMDPSAVDRRSEYAGNLLKLAQRMAQSTGQDSGTGSAQKTAAGLALGVFDDGSLERRVMNLIEKKTKQTLVRTMVSATVGVGMLAGVAGVSAWFGLKPVLAEAAPQAPAQGSTHISVSGSPEDSAAPAGWVLAGDKAANYRTGLDRAMKHNALPSAYLASRVKETGGFGTLMQSFSAANYAGKRVRLRGWVKSEDVAAWAGLWMRIDKGDAVAGFDNMEQRPIKGTRGWASYDVVLDVPADATGIAFGVLVSGPGEVWINDLKFEVVGPEVATTARRSGGAVADAPVNLGFER